MPREGKPEQLQHLHSDDGLCFSLFSSPFSLSCLTYWRLAYLMFVAEMRVYNILHIAQRQVEHMGSPEVDISQWMSVKLLVKIFNTSKKGNL